MISLHYVFPFKILFFNDLCEFHNVRNALIRDHYYSHLEEMVKWLC